MDYFIAMITYEPVGFLIFVNLAWSAARRDADSFAFVIIQALIIITYGNGGY